MHYLISLKKLSVNECRIEPFNARAHYVVLTGDKSSCLVTVKFQARPYMSSLCRWTVRTYDFPEDQLHPLISPLQYIDALLLVRRPICAAVYHLLGSAHMSHHVTCHIASQRAIISAAKNGILSDAYIAPRAMYEDHRVCAICSLWRRSCD